MCLLDFLSQAGLVKHQALWCGLTVQVLWLMLKQPYSQHRLQHCEVHVCRTCCAHDANQPWCFDSVTVAVMLQGNVLF